jgi:hypothetical protein
MNLHVSLIMLVEAHPLLFHCDGVTMHSLFDHMNRVKAVYSQLAMSVVSGDTLS